MIHHCIHSGFMSNLRTLFGVSSPWRLTRHQHYHLFAQVFWLVALSHVESNFVWNEKFVTFKNIYANWILTVVSSYWLPYETNSRLMYFTRLYFLSKTLSCIDWQIYWEATIRDHKDTGLIHIRPGVGEIFRIHEDETPCDLVSVFKHTLFIINIPLIIFVATIPLQREHKRITTEIYSAAM